MGNYSQRFGIIEKMLNSGSDNKLIIQPRYGLPCIASLKYYRLLHWTVFLVTSVPLSFSSLSGWGGHQQRRLHLQLLPILEGSLTWTRPFTARRYLWPLSDKRKAKSQSLFFWCHGNLKVIGVWFCSDTCRQTWGWKWEAVQQTDTSKAHEDCLKCIQVRCINLMLQTAMVAQSESGCSEWASCCWKISVTCCETTVRFALQQPRSYSEDQRPIFLKLSEVFPPQIIHIFI